MAGHARHTAAWHTNVGNEHGQVLTSVVTAREGGGLQAIAFVKRYSEAGVQPPEVLYIDRDCCSAVPGRKGKASKMFASWPSLQVRLDMWHFMRRIASGVTTESPAICPIHGFIVIGHFKWDRNDLEVLKAAKRLRILTFSLLSFGERMASPKSKSDILTMTVIMCLHCCGKFVEAISP